MRWNVWKTLTKISQSKKDWCNIQIVEKLHTHPNAHIIYIPTYKHTRAKH